MKFGFVILHYMAFDMTVECVEQILKLFSDKQLSIVIVDNASSNESGKKLREKYNNNESVEVLINHKNLGFAQGNNLGYLYLKANCSCDFIIIMNNDVIIEQTDFLDKIQSLYKDTCFAVLGPDIYSPKLKGSQSPTYRNNVELLYGNKYENVLEIHCRLKNYNQKIYYYWFRHILFGLIRKIVPNKFEKKSVSPELAQLDYSKNLENVVLHGACYILSRNFIEKRMLAFNPDTFLYFEEDILHYECKMQNLKMVYSPYIKVVHLEDVSTDTVYKTSLRKNMFKNKLLEHSTKIYLQLVSSHGGGKK